MNFLPAQQLRRKMLQNLCSIAFSVLSLYSLVKVQFDCLVAAAFIFAAIALLLADKRYLLSSPSDGMRRQSGGCCRKRQRQPAG